jgi:hypothetical protein
MHQDAYIFQRMDLGGVGVADYLLSSIEQCSIADGSLDPAIADTWRGILERCYPPDFSTNLPDIARWHKAFTDVLEATSGGYHLIPIARHVAVDCGLTYPNVDEVDRPTYIDNLKTPHGQQPYDQIFEKTIEHVIQGWHLIGEAVFADSTLYQTAFWDWNLDTGRDSTNRLVLWEENAL